MSLCFRTLVIDEPRKKKNTSTRKAFDTKQWHLCVLNKSFRAFHVILLIFCTFAPNKEETSYLAFIQIGLHPNTSVQKYYNFCKHNAVMKRILRKNQIKWSNHCIINGTWMILSTEMRPLDHESLKVKGKLRFDISASTWFTCEKSRGRAEYK